ncbi:hypothetical protein M3Y99_01798700 [Aphelenchoides fujianensis]|nr:hypothetical protein M3Y99_01798700 [Aphelenchoides fujianensis]
MEIEQHQREGLNATTSARDLERLCQADGRTIRNETIKPHEDLTIPNVPRLRAVDFMFVEKALPHFKAITRDYFYQPLESSFNWDETAERLGLDKEGTWFIVAFRSVRRADACGKTLYQADAQAHQEAIESGGLLKYWYGTLDDQRQCLAMCIWSNREFARVATVKPLHIQAVSLTRRMYVSYTLERYQLIKRKGVAHFEIQSLGECCRTVA